MVQSPQAMEETLANFAQDMERLLKEPVGSRRIKVSDLTPREGQQTKLATRVPTEDLLPLCELLDGCGFYAVEVWGGATFDTCIRYLKEDPWERLRRIKKVMPKTKLQMLLRGQHILAYHPFSDKIVRTFVERAVMNGMNVFRVFEATNDFRNLEVALRAVKDFGGEAHVEVNYTVSPVHTLELWMQYAEQLLNIGADWLSLKDATGIIVPFDAYRIIRGIKERAKGKLPVLFHCHDMGGASSMCLLMAILAGADMIDTCLSPLSFGASHPATETMVASLRDTPFDTGIDLRSLEAPAAIARQIREKYERYATEYTGVSGEVFVHKIPGGMISNMVAQLKEVDRMDLMEAALAEIPSVERDMGYPPLLTPTSQVVGVQAVLNVVGGERYKILMRETRDYVRGFYGQPPGPLSRELIQKVMGDEEPDYSIRAGDLADPAEWERAVEALGPLAKNEEDILLGVLFPMQAKDLLTLRENGQLEQAHLEAIAAAPPKAAEAVAEAPPRPAEAPAPPPAVAPPAMSAPVEFDAVYQGRKFHVQIAGTGEPLAPGAPVKYFLKIDGRLEEIEVRPLDAQATDEGDVLYHGDRIRVQVAGVGERRRPGAPRRYFLRVNERLEELEVYPLVELARSATAAPSAVVSAPSPVAANPTTQAATGAPPQIPRPTQPGDVTPPMAGRVARVVVNVGDVVRKGQTVVVVEAMKMETEVQSPVGGVVEAIYVQPGDSVTSDMVLVRVV